MTDTPHSDSPRSITSSSVRGHRTSGLQLGWLSAQSESECRAWQEAFWPQMKGELENDEFWADRIRGLRESPIQRLELALDHLPLPAAFRESAIAVRSLIREKRKHNASYDKELSLLYWLAAVRSFIVPYSSRLKQPGYNVIESVPPSVLAGLDVEYLSLGFEKLELLNKTDCKWLSESWGEPQSHHTLNELYPDVWRKYEDVTRKTQEDRLERMADELQAEFSDTPTSVESWHVRESRLSQKPRPRALRNDAEIDAQPDVPRPDVAKDQSNRPGCFGVSCMTLGTIVTMLSLVSIFRLSW